MVNKQAEDEGLWFIAQTASEAYLQQELRRLHSVIEMENRLSPATADQQVPDSAYLTDAEHLAAGAAAPAPTVQRRWIARAATEKGWHSRDAEVAAKEADVLEFQETVVRLVNELADLRQQLDAANKEWQKTIQRSGQFLVERDAALAALLASTDTPAS